MEEVEIGVYEAKPVGGGQDVPYTKMLMQIKNLLIHNNYAMLSTSI